MAEALRGAVIGCGFFARNHLHAWADIADARIVAVCDMDRAKAEAAATTFDVPAYYADAAEMFLRERLDFVDIVTTMPTHRALVELAARHRVPTIVQKPFAPTFDDCVAMVAACKAAGIPLMVHENFRFQTPLHAVRRVIDSGEIGEPYFGRVSFRTGYDIISGQPYLAREERFVILDLGVHVLDMARVYFGEAETIYAQTQQIRENIRAEDMATMLLRHRSGATCIVDCTYSSWVRPDPFPQTLVTIEGTRGGIHLHPGYRMEVTSDGRTREETVSSPLLSWTSEPWHTAQESVLHTQRHWVECLRAGRAPQTSGEDNLRTYALVDAAYVSAAERRAVAPRV